MFKKLSLVCAAVLAGGFMFSESLVADGGASSASAGSVNATRFPSRKSELAGCRSESRLCLRLWQDRKALLSSSTMARRNSSRKTMLLFIITALILAVLKI